MATLRGSFGLILGLGAIALGPNAFGQGETDRDKALFDLSPPSKVILKFAKETIEADPTLCTTDPKYPSIEYLTSGKVSQRDLYNTNSIEPYLAHHASFKRKLARYWNQAKEYFPPRLQRTRFRNKFKTELAGPLGPELQAQLNRLQALNKCAERIDAMRARLRQIHNDTRKAIKANKTQLRDFQQEEQVLLRTYRDTLGDSQAGRAAAAMLGYVDFPRTLDFVFGDYVIDRAGKVPLMRGLFKAVEPLCGKYKDYRMMGVLKLKKGKTLSYRGYPHRICELLKRSEDYIIERVKRGANGLSKDFVRSLEGLPKKLKTEGAFIPFERGEERQLDLLLAYDKTILALGAKLKPLLDAVPVKPEPSMFAYYTKLFKAVWATIDELASTIALPKKLKKRGKGPLKYAMGYVKAAGGRVIGGNIDKDWLVHKNDWDLPTARTKDGSVIFKMPNEKWCRQQRFVFNEPYIAKGKFGKSKDVELMYFRFVKCP